MMKTTDSQAGMVWSVERATATRNVLGPSPRHGLLSGQKSREFRKWQISAI